MARDQILWRLVHLYVNWEIHMLLEWTYICLCTLITNEICGCRYIYMLYISHLDNQQCHFLWSLYHVFLLDSYYFSVCHHWSLVEMGRFFYVKVQTIDKETLVESMKVGYPNVTLTKLRQMKSIQKFISEHNSTTKLHLWIQL